MRALCRSGGGALIAAVLLAAFATVLAAPASEPAAANSATNAAANSATNAAANSATNAAANAARTWPQVALPPDAEAYSMGEQLSVDGMPMRLQGFETDSSPERTAEWFRQHMPRPLMENQVGNKLVLGRAIGTYYVTVQLERAAAGRNGTRGVLAVSDVAAALRQREASRAANERLLARLPAGTKIVSALNSADQRRSASFVTMVNSYNEEVNRERLQQMLEQDGMQLEREGRGRDAGADTLAALPSGAANGRTMFFKGRGREATAVISRLPDSRVSIVLNTVTTMESYP